MSSLLFLQSSKTSSREPDQHIDDEEAVAEEETAEVAIATIDMVEGVVS